MLGAISGPLSLGGGAAGGAGGALSFVNGAGGGNGYSQLSSQDVVGCMSQLFVHAPSGILLITLAVLTIITRGVAVVVA